MTSHAGTEEPRYLAGGLSEKGRRESNEDAAILAVLPPSSALRAFAVLSDGMGGHNAGEVASRLTVEILRTKVQALAARPDASSLAPATIEAEIREWIDEVNREIFQRGKASAEQKGMGATLAFALVLPDDRLVVANVGDSKIFLASGLKVRQLSVDHTALAEHRRALGSDSVAPEDDASNPFAHALTRSLGQERQVVPDVRSDVTLGPGDVLILTTDGVTDVLEAERFLTALESAGSLQEAAIEIYRLALEAGTKDNVSVALLSRGTPARLGLGRSVVAAGGEPPPRGDEMLVAGAASGPAAAGPASRAPRRAAGIVVGLIAVAAIAAALLILPRVSSKGESPAGAPASAGPPVAAVPSGAPASAPPADSSAPLPPDSPSKEHVVASAAAAPPAPVPTGAVQAAAPLPTAVASAARPTTRAAKGPPEPSFRAPAAFSGLQPLEFPPTPTDTPTPTVTPTATDTATPVIAPPAAPGRPPASPAAPSSPTPAAGA